MYDYIISLWVITFVINDYEHHDKLFCCRQINDKYIQIQWTPLSSTTRIAVNGELSHCRLEIKKSSQMTRSHIFIWSRAGWRWMIISPVAVRKRKYLREWQNVSLFFVFQLWNRATSSPVAVWTRTHFSKWRAISSSFYFVIITIGTSNIGKLSPRACHITSSLPCVIVINHHLWRQQALIKSL